MEISAGACSQHNESGAFVGYRAAFRLDEHVVWRGEHIFDDENRAAAHARYVFGAFLAAACSRYDSSFD